MGRVWSTSRELAATAYGRLRPADVARQAVPGVVKTMVVDSRRRAASAAPDYIEPAIQYYIAARQSVFLEFSPIAGALCHHAFEMLMKALLVRHGYTRKQLAQKPLGHDLVNIWDAFKKAAGDPSLALYDDLMEVLHWWEQMRYPDTLPAPTLVQTVLVPTERELALARTAFVKPVGELYVLSLRHTDELFQRIVASSPIYTARVSAVKASLTQEARAIYARENQHSIW
jgi:hypothetical protein